MEKWSHTLAPCDPGFHPAIEQSRSLPPCGAQKNHRAARLLDFFDRRISSNPCRSASAFGGTNRSPAPQPPRPAPPPNPLPQGRGRGCGAERRQWRMQRGGAPVAVEKIEQASSAKIFSGTARRMGQMRPRLPWSVSVRSTDDALHRSYPALPATERGSSRGNPSPLTLFCFLLQEQKEGLRGERY